MTLGLIKDYMSFNTFPELLRIKMKNKKNKTKKQTKPKQKITLAAPAVRIKNRSV